MYILEGDNIEEEKMSMTTPVITNRDTMAFVMPSGMNSENAPTPRDMALRVEDVPKQIVAVREFTGLVTEKESAKQRAALEDSLVSDGIEFDNLSFKTLQYNPPSRCLGSEETRYLSSLLLMWLPTKDHQMMMSQPLSWRQNHRLLNTKHRESLTSILKNAIPKGETLRTILRIVKVGWLLGIARFEGIMPYKC